MVARIARMFRASFADAPHAPDVAAIAESTPLDPAAVKAMLDEPVTPYVVGHRVVVPERPGWHFPDRPQADPFEQAAPVTVTLDMLREVMRRIEDVPPPPEQRVVCHALTDIPAQPLQRAVFSGSLSILGVPVVEREWMPKGRIAVMPPWLLDLLDDLFPPAEKES